MLYEPAQSLTDLALGIVTVALAVLLGRSEAANRHWRAAFWWFGVAALGGAVHHGVFNRWDRAGLISWTVISVIVVVAVSYVLAATVTDVLGPGRAKAFWLLRSLGLAAYLIVAVTGHAGVGAILACESLTMLSVLALWGLAAWRRHPMAPGVIVAVLASGGASGLKAVSPEVTAVIGLDPTSAYHVAQILGTILLYDAVRGRRAVSTEMATSQAPA
jgi:hypothetical protein